MNKKLILPDSYIELTEKEMLEIRGGVILSNNNFGMSDEEYLKTIELLEEKGIASFSDELLISFFEQTLLNINNSYNNNMEKYSMSEKYYEICKDEILHRFKRI